MDLWIRPQTKIGLINAENICIRDDAKLVKYGNDLNLGNYAILGEYKSKERALEVLDEIESFIENNYLSIDDIPSHDNVPFPGYYQTYFTTKTRKKVFQMPKE